MLVSSVILLFGLISASFTLELAPYSLSGHLYPYKYVVTVSGTESGGVFAQTMHITHSKYIKGCAIYSSTFYRCGLPNGDVNEYKAQCTRRTGLAPENRYQISQAVTEIASYETNHLIDSIRHLRYGRLYVFCGLENPEFWASQMLAPVGLYENYLSSPYSIFTRVQNTDQLVPVIDSSEPSYSDCSTTYGPDYTLSPNCSSLSVPGEALGFLLKGTYLTYQNPFYPRLHYANLEPLRTFNQTEFTSDLNATGLDDTGYFYVPKYCQYRSHSHREGHGYRHEYSKPCMVHVYFHGCNQGREFIGTSHILRSNYLEIAEANYLIMLFPQALSSQQNPGGCFDYVGFTGPLYATKNGAQVQAVWRMIERLLYILPERKTPMPGSQYRSYGGYESGGSYMYRRSSRDLESPNNIPLTRQKKECSVCKNTRKGGAR